MDNAAKKLLSSQVFKKKIKKKTYIYTNVLFLIQKFYTKPPKIIIHMFLLHDAFKKQAKEKNQLSCKKKKKKRITY